ncbi:cytochrome P460 family protein [Chryseobacterium viscerum]|uniref:cytochrome P460 family protein n=1 Tax=Chryseobacterium TaxID=59732 RepID=UPI002221683E|nr:cytochrome P460 family protein [Chryseobacterium viscerum]MCW1961600.1 cytochrome P460 family protein [Chryseobacterium viscerum]WPO92748.1 cytochrome P460 family protein [Chryseobacterium sp. HR92]
MKNTILILLVSLVSLTACSKENNDTNNGLSRVVFDPGHLKFISNSLNPKRETMSALYGNEKALESLSKESQTPEAGAVMKLVTWKYHDNPQYIGGTITGELVSIETVQADHLGNISYDLKNDLPQNSSPDKEERIQYFMSYQPVNRP